MKKIQEMIGKAHRIAIGGHVRPDGDCVGSCMALYQYIGENFPEKEVTVYLEKLPQALTLFSVTEEILHEVQEPLPVYDLFICLDCGSADRLGFSVGLFQRAKHTCCIDHHVSNKAFADECYIVPRASSTSELVYDVLEPDKISRETATLLYLGLVHDTGVFQYANVSPKTLRIAAALLEKGVDAATLIRKTYYEKTDLQNQLLGYCLQHRHLSPDGQYISAYLTAETMEQAGAKPGDLEGIVSQLRLTQGVKLAIFLYETTPGLYKVSLRSEGEVDVSRLAVSFGGGGHMRAAGCSVKGEPEQIIAQIQSRAESALKGE